MTFHVDRHRTHLTTVVAILAVTLVAAALAISYVAARGSSSKPSRAPLLRRGAHVSAALQPAALASPPKKARPHRSEIVSCERPGPANHVANCKSEGRPAVEPWVIARGPLLYAAAGDYNSWNGQAALGFYWSRDGRTCFDGGPLDLFAHDNKNSAGGDPQLVLDAAGVVYYSSVHFNFARCGVGGVELARRDPVTGAWHMAQLAANSKTALQDRPAIAVDSGSVYFAWTRFASCQGDNGPSQLRVALLPTGSANQAITSVLAVPGSNFSQSASIGTDGSGGFWLAWEEYPDASASDGWMELIHWSRSAGWSAAQTISPSGFRDLPSPLPGFHFATDSAPSLAVVRGQPWVAWASSDTGIGRISLWSRGGLATVADEGGDQLMPALSRDGHGGIAVSFGQVDRRSGSLAWLLSARGRTRVVSSRSSYPNDDVFFSGKFIGDYTGMTLFAGSPLAVWTDLRQPLGGTVETPSAMTAR
jgi:hypothetical protein